MRRFIKLLRTPLIVISLLAVVTAPFVSLLQSSPAYAEVSSTAVVATWASNGTVIGLSGNTMYAVASLQSYPFTPGFSGGAVVVDSKGTACQATALVKDSSTTSGTLSFGAKPPVAQRADQPPPSPPYCSAAVISSLPSGTIAIGGSKSDPNPPKNVTPPAENPYLTEIGVTVYSPKPFAELPKGMEVHLIGTGGFREVRTIDWKNDSIGFIHFDGQRPGTYQVCATPAGVFDFDQCKSVTKAAGKTAFVEIGSAANVYNENGKAVDVTVSYAIPQANGPKTYGPVSLRLIRESGELVSDSTLTSSSNFADAAPAQGDLKLSGKINAVEPGRYKVCIADTELCSVVFTKTANVAAAATIAVSAEQSDALLANNEAASSCVIDGVGWIICPVVNLMANMVDGAYAFVESLLVVQPLLTTGDTAGIYTAWSVMRNFANVAFVIAFIIIIYSQLTGAGLNNYGIKKMLPRLIIAAILVNVSYWVCAIAVDISNIMGSSVNGLFDGIKGGIPGDVNKSPIATGEGWVGIAGFVLAGAGVTVAIMYVLFSALLPALIAALLAIVTVFIVLTLRQALIILLIVIAPLAFVAFLLPNTEGLFKKWRQLFQVLLLMYPIIAFLFGASALASFIVMRSASGDYKIAIQIMGALISIIPLALTPIVMRTAGGVLNKVGGVINNPNKGPFDRMRKGAEGIHKRGVNRANNKAMNSKRIFSPRRSVQRRSARLEAADQNQQRELTRGQTEYVAEATANNTMSASQRMLNVIPGITGKGLQDQMVAGGTDGAAGRAQGSAETIRAKLEAEEVTAGTAVIESLNLNPSQLRDLSIGMQVTNSSGRTVDSSNDYALRAAARRQVINTGDAVGVANLVDESSRWTGADAEKDRINFANSLQASNLRPSWASQGQLAGIRQGTNTNTTNQMIEEAILNNTYSPSVISTADKDEINMVARVAKTSTIINNPANAVAMAAKARLQANANFAMTDSELSAKISKSLGDVTDLKDGVMPSRTIS